MVVELTTTDVAHGGYCVGRYEGMVVFVTGALPGETIRAEITGKRSKLWYARTVEVLQASPDRIPHVWPLAERTGIGGADLGHVSPDGARRWKARVVETQMARVAHHEVQVEVEAAPVEPLASALAWRTRVGFQIDEAGRLGMYAAKSHTLIPVDGMPLAHEEIQQALARDLAAGVVRAAGGSASYVRASVSGLVSRIRPPSRGGRMAPDRATVLESVECRYGSWQYEVAVDGFWQVHRAAPQVLVEAVLDAADEVTGPVYDLYAGAGLFSVPLAERTSGPVVTIEGSPLSVACLHHNTATYGVDCYVGDVTKTLAGLRATSGGLVVCDPPRSGAGAQAVAQIVRMSPDKVIYVACDPAALARDVSLFASQGYGLASLRAFDLFPFTHHVECVAVLVPDTFGEQ